MTCGQLQLMLKGLEQSSSACHSWQTQAEHHAIRGKVMVGQA